MAATTIVSFNYFRDGVAADPLTLAFRLFGPGIATESWFWPRDAEIVRDSVGQFHIVTPANIPGDYAYQWIATADGISNPASTIGGYTVGSTGTISISNGTIIPPPILPVGTGAVGTLLTGNGLGVLPSFQALAGGLVDLVNPQTIAGIKTFTGVPVFPAGSIPQGAIAGGYVDLVNPQTVAGAKTFSSPLSIVGAFGGATGLWVNPASGHTGLLMDLQEAGVSKVSINNAGLINATALTTYNSIASSVGTVTSIAVDPLSTMTMGNASDGLGGYIPALSAGSPLAITQPIRARYSGAVALITRGAPSQSVNLQEWQISTGSVVGSINSAGSLVLAGNILANGTVSLNYIGDYADTGDYLAFRPSGSGIVITARGAATNFYVQRPIAATAGIGLFGHGVPVTQPARAVTLADVIAVLAGMGATA